MTIEQAIANNDAEALFAALSSESPGPADTIGRSQFRLRNGARRESFAVYLADGRASYSRRTWGSVGASEQAVDVSPDVLADAFACFRGGR